jgi:quercetin dioxygenase-like cupin family protein
MRGEGGEAFDFAFEDTKPMIDDRDLLDDVGAVAARAWCWLRAPCGKRRFKEIPKERRMHSTTRLVVLVATFFCGSLLAYPAHAQEGMKRTILHQADLTGASGMEVISSIVEVQPGTTIPRHFHHGIEAAYVIEGAMIQDPGKEPRMLPTGANAFNLRDAVHGGFTVVGDKALKLFTVHVVDKGKPLFAEGK